MTTETMIALAGFAITLALFGLGIVVGIIGYFLKTHMAKVEEQLAELPGIRSDLAVLVERQTNQGHRIERHAIKLDEHEKSLSRHGEALGVLALKGER
jgi:hypothetical protein